MGESLPFTEINLKTGQPIPLEMSDFGQQRNGHHLTPEELVSKSDGELLQLQAYYKEKIAEEKKYDVYRAPKGWMREHRRTTLFVFIVLLLLGGGSFAFAMKNNSTPFGIVAGACFVVLVSAFAMLDTSRIEPYFRNLEVVELMIRARAATKKQLGGNPVNGKVVAVVNTLKDLKEANFTMLLKKVREKTPISEKTLRGYLTDELKDVVGRRQGAYNSVSRSQQNATVYYMKEESK